MHKEKSTGNMAHMVHDIVVIPTLKTPRKTELSVSFIGENSTLVLTAGRFVTPQLRPHFSQTSCRGCCSSINALEQQGAFLLSNLAIAFSSTFCPRLRLLLFRLRGRK